MPQEPDHQVCRPALKHTSPNLLHTSAHPEDGDDDDGTHLTILPGRFKDDGGT